MCSKCKIRNKVNRFQHGATSWVEPNIEELLEELRQSVMDSREEHPFG